MWLGYGEWDWSLPKGQVRCNLKLSLRLSNTVELEWGPFGGVMDWQPQQSRWRTIQEKRLQMWWEWAPFWDICLWKGGESEGNRWGRILLIFFFCFLMRKTKWRNNHWRHRREKGWDSPWGASCGKGYGAHVEELALSAGVHSSIVNLGQIRGNRDFEVFLMGPERNEIPKCQSDRLYNSPNQLRIVRLC